MKNRFKKYKIGDRIRINAGIGDDHIHESMIYGKIIAIKRNRSNRPQCEYEIDFDYGTNIEGSELKRFGTFYWQRGEFRRDSSGDVVISLNALFFVLV